MDTLDLMDEHGRTRTCRFCPVSFGSSRLRLWLRRGKPGFARFPSDSVGYGRVRRKNWLPEVALMVTEFWLLATAGVMLTAAPRNGCIEVGCGFQDETGGIYRPGEHDVGTGMGVAEFYVEEFKGERIGFAGGDEVCATAAFFEYLQVVSAGGQLGNEDVFDVVHRVAAAGDEVGGGDVV